MDPIKYIFEKPALTGKIAQYDIVHVTQKAIKGSILADYLARNSLVDYYPMRHGFPDEDMALLEDHRDKEEWIMLLTELPMR
ncbi:hypothetical protein CR513_31865, partial [Mucuna pruriens]